MSLAHDIITRLENEARTLSDRIATLKRIAPELSHDNAEIRKASMLITSLLASVNATDQAFAESHGGGIVMNAPSAPASPRDRSFIDSMYRAAGVRAADPV
ncbi:MAG: hypothetical protein WD768_07780 [Phycisphaeraceae bacterium]